MVNKGHPYWPLSGGPSGFLSDEEIDKLKDMGVNFVRFGVLWRAVETAPGVYNQTYLDEAEKYVNKLGEKGIYSLLDSHQDVFSQAICGEGFPDFYANYNDLNHYCSETWIGMAAEYLGVCQSLTEMGAKVSWEGKVESCGNKPWAEYYVSTEVNDAFARLYQNKDGLQDAYINFFD